MKKIRNRFKSLLIKLFSYVSLHLRFRRFQKAILFEVMEKMSGRQEFQRFFEELYQKALRGMFIGMGGSVEESGELYVLKYIKEDLLSPPPPPNTSGIIVFDVGANIGKYTKMVYSTMGNQVQIYAFEPSKVTYEKLLQNTEKMPTVNCCNFGLGEKSAKLTLYSDADESGLASLYKRNLAHFNIEMGHEESVEIKTIDDFCFSNKIPHIHLLKMDVEGNELNVLRGAKRLLESDHIDFIQFEFGGCNIDSRTYFQDFYYLLKDQYAIYRIVKNGIFQINEYKEMYECFTATNFFAVRKGIL